MTRDELEAAMQDIAERSIAARKLGMPTVSADLRTEWWELKDQLDALIAEENKPKETP